MACAQNGRLQSHGAATCSDTSYQWINYFLHTGHLSIDGLRMSKSLKNFITIRCGCRTGDSPAWGLGERHPDACLAARKFIGDPELRSLNRLRLHILEGKNPHSFPICHAAGFTFFGSSSISVKCT